jgi:hypothetical protein
MYIESATKQFGATFPMVNTDKSYRGVGLINEKFQVDYSVRLPVVGNLNGENKLCCETWNQYTLSFINIFEQIKKRLHYVRTTAN